MGTTIIYEARRLRKPMIIDFSADWCAPCRALDDVTFHDLRVVEEARESFVMIKIDLTRKGDPVHEWLLREYRIKGVPTIVFLSSQGKELDTLRLVDFVSPGAFLDRMAMAKKGSDTEREKRVEEYMLVVQLFLASPPASRNNTVLCVEKAGP